MNSNEARSIDVAKYREMRQQDAQLTWQLEQPTSGHYIVTTPNKIQLTITESIDWHLEPDDQYQSTLLWLYSLIPLRLIADRYGDYALVNSSVRSFHDYASSAQGEQRFEGLTSRDHMTAEYVRTLTYLLTDERFESLHEARELIIQASHWAMKPGTIARNNHGMMLALSVIHAEEIVGTEALHGVAKEASSKLIAILRQAFDDTGLCRENSPAYHHFYIRYMKSIVTEAKVLGGALRELIPEIEHLIRRAESTLTKIALPDGSLPPFGDGNHWPAAVDSGGPDEHFSPDSGFYMVRDKNTYLSFKCGNSSITHKHMDDNAIYLWNAGETIIADGGLYNYDWTNRFTLCVKSQRGHSSPHFQKYDNTYPATLYRDGSVRVKSEIELSKTGSSTTLHGTYTIDNNFTSNRTISFFDITQLSICDTFSSSGPERKKIRFLMPGHFTITVSGRVVHASSTQNDVRINFSSGRLSVIRAADDGAHADGWVATGFGSVDPAWAIDVHLDQNENRLDSRIQLNSVR